MAGRKVVNNRPKTIKIRANEQFAKAIEDITVIIIIIIIIIINSLFFVDKFT